MKKKLKKKIEYFDWGFCEMPIIISTGIHCFAALSFMLGHMVENTWYSINIHTHGRIGMGFLITSCIFDSIIILFLLCQVILHIPKSVIGIEAKLKIKVHGISFLLELISFWGSNYNFYGHNKKK